MEIKINLLNLKYCRMGKMKSLLINIDPDNKHIQNKHIELVLYNGKNKKLEEENKTFMGVVQ